MSRKSWEKKYKEIVQEVGENQYRILYPDDDFIHVLYSGMTESYKHDFMGACIASGATLSTININLKCEGYVIPGGSQVIAWRTFRYCEHDGTRHLNADDNIMFPDKKGNIWKVSKRDSEDHYIKIATYAGLQNIVQAYHLPTEIHGPCSKYVENGASVPIRIEYEEKGK